MSKILHLVLANKGRMNESWIDQFDGIGIASEVSFIYQQGWTVEFANRVFAFIILSYDNKSGWIEMHKNRLDNKRNIMKKLGGNVSEKEVSSVVEGRSLAANRLRIWFMKYQRDWRWDTIMTCFDYHAEMMEFGGARTMEELEDVEYIEDEENGIREEKTYREVPVDKLAKGNLDKGKNIAEGIAMRQKGEALWEEIKKEYVQLDSALEKEGFKRITEQVDIFSWEAFIASLR